MSKRMSAIKKYRFERWCYLHHLTPVAWIVRSWIYLIHNSFVPYLAEIGEGTDFDYKGIAVVIHSRAVIGKDCEIGTCVTIGGKAGGVPVIGDRVKIKTGAKIIGEITIGDDAVIGANAVVLQQVE